MATNVGPGTNFSNNVNPGEGIIGNLYNRMARANFNREVWGNDKDSGLLNKGLKDLENTIKELNKLSKDTETYDKKSIEVMRNKIKILKEEYKLTEKMINIGEASDSEILDRIKQQKAALIDTYVTEQKLIEKNTKLTKEEIEQRTEFYRNEIKNQKDLGNQIFKLTKDLEKGSSNTIKSIGTTVSSIGDTLGKLSNIFNLDKLANNAIESSVRSNLSLQNQLTKQYGITSNQFNNFKSGLVGNLSTLNYLTGNLFSGNDMIEYMKKLDKYNITSTQIEEQQLKNSIMATKYLGVSDETQTNIFKYMKVTNDYNMLDTHNKTITGILKSQLGVSTSQLDQLTQLVQSTQDVQFASGMSIEAMNKYQETSSVLGSVLSKQLGSDYAKSISTVLGKMVSASYSDMPSLAQAYGVTYDDIRRLQESGDVFSIYNKLLSSGGYNRYNITGTPMGTNELVKILGGDIGAVAAMRGATGKETSIARDYSTAIQNIREGVESVESYVQQTTEATLSEKLQNKMSEFYVGIDWKYTTNLANLALGAIVSGDILQGIGTISSIVSNFKLNNLTEALTGSLDKSGISAGMSKLVSGGIAVGLTGLTIATLVNGYKNTMNVGKSEENLASETDTTSQGSLDRAWNRTKAIIGGIASGAYGGYSSLFGEGAKDAGFRKAKWGMLVSHARTNYSDKDSLLYRIAGLMLNDKGNNLDLIDFEGRNWLVNRYNGLSEDDKLQVQYLAAKIQNLEETRVFGSDGNVVMPNSIDWNNYHKAGLTFVPKENYKALLHRGEMVLNVEQAEQYRKAMNIDRYGNSLGNYMGGEADGTPRPKGKIISGYPWVMTAGYPSYPSRRST